MNKKKAITGRGSNISIIDEFIKSDNADCKHEWRSTVTVAYNSKLHDVQPASNDYVCKKCGQTRSKELYSLRSDGVLVFTEAIKAEAEREYYNAQKDIIKDITGN